MITVALGTFDWKSLKQLRVMPVNESIVMVATVTTVVITHDLSLGVMLGILLSAVFFARKVGKLIEVELSTPAPLHQRYTVRGQLFFVSVEQFVAGFEFDDAIRQVEIDLALAHVWDASAVAAIDQVVLKLRRQGAVVHLFGLNAQSTALLGRLAVHDRPGATLSVGH